MRTLVVLFLSWLVGCGGGGGGTGPKLVIVGPATGTVLFAPSATLTFRVDEAAVDSYDIAINGASRHIARAIGVGETEVVELPLAAGVNTIDVAVTGEDGADHATIVLVVDAEVPLVELDTPAAGETTYAASTEVRGRIVSTHAVTAAVVRIGPGTAMPLAVEATASGYAFTGTVALALGGNAVFVEVTDERTHVGRASAVIERLLDDAAPATAIAFPRDGQAVRTRQVLVRGTVTDQSSVASVTVEANAQVVAASLAAGEYAAMLPLVPGMNTVTIRAKDGFGNERVVESHVYYGQRLGAGGAHGGALRAGGRIFTWGRNNLGQTGLAYVSHESRTAYCERTLATVRDIALCKATTIAAIDAVCLNPGFVLPVPGDSPEAAACRTATRARRDAVCDAAGANAPANCKSSTTANLATACDAAYGAGTPASGACEASLACDGAYAAGTPERASCAAVAGVVPSMFPAPATPYAPIAIDAFVPTPGTTQTFAQLATTFTSLAFNQNGSAALDAAGQVWTWGDGGSGALCLGDTLDRDRPHRVPAFGAAGTTAVAIARGYDHLLVLRSDGSVWGCGLNTSGQVGTATSVPAQIAGLPATIVQVVASAASSYALTASGEVYAWGRNQYGNLGNGATSTAPSPTPLLVPNLTNVAMLAAGRDHVLAARRDGSVVAWGLNASHQVNGSADNVLSPVAIAGVADARAVYANGNQGFVENAAGQLLGWGQNGSGNLGIPDDDDQPAPVTPVFGLASVLDVAIGALQGFAMKGDQVFGWGWSFHGSLGAGSSAIHTWPYRTPLLVAFP